ncbi:hypothetical protein Pan241w_00950 [Gimesia alba]|uniref:Uncharacterized protein n=1 Tax=Gimesia alba TaxID=2527973 RepID=A0A517R841_9PLAN|nr:hypothetical protein [Gimesia alba]QDT40042.1 hypothetical protein Pan241w_00950 [Gimesia alba]
MNTSRLCAWRTRYTVRVLCLNGDELDFDQFVCGILLAGRNVMLVITDKVLRTFS